jgi:hypothetical protein
MHARSEQGGVIACTHLIERICDPSSNSDRYAFES